MFALDVGFLLRPMQWRREMRSSDDALSIQADDA
jgi:hypothetical protein